jgi:hypothetical protein
MIARLADGQNDRDTKHMVQLHCPDLRSSAGRRCRGGLPSVGWCNTTDNIGEWLLAVASSPFCPSKTKKKYSKKRDKKQEKNNKKLLDVSFYFPKLCRCISSL